MLTLVVRDERTWHRASARLMGTVADVLVDGDVELIAAGFRRLRSLERAWTRFDPDSELNRLLRSAGTWHPVSDDLLRAITWSRRMHDETHGLFDPSIRRSLERAGYDRTFADLPVEVGEPAFEQEPCGIEPAPGCDGIEVDHERQMVRMPAGLSIDLGGIGKGLAADIVAAELLALGARAVYISLGGDIHAQGEPPRPEGWTVPLLHPRTGATIAEHRLVDGGLVMSTTALRRWRHGSTWSHHIIDPRTGQPTNTDILAVAVAAPSAARAEALAKATIILGADAGSALLRGFGIQAWIMTTDIAGCSVVEIEESACWP